MARYRIKSVEGRNAHLDLIDETPDGFLVRITRYHDGYETNQTESMSKALFDTCVRTGYLVEVPSNDFAVDVAS